MKVLHVTKQPPSHSGVALYASVFREVLSTIGPVEVVDTGGDPAATQSLRASAYAFLRGIRMYRGRADLVHVELSGRALVEFFYALGVAVGPARRRPVLVVTAHDGPSLVGASLLFRVLDRRGGRRLGLGLSRVVGERLEVLMLRRCTAVLALTEAAAQSLEEHYGVAVTPIPHVVDAPEPSRPQAVVLLPGPVDDIDAVRDVLDVVNCAPLSTDGPWSVVVGSCSDEVEDVLDEARCRLPKLTAERTGFLPERAVLAQFDRAAVVVRTRRSGGHNGLAASGPLHWAAARGCLAITDDDRAGAHELAAVGLVERTDDVVGALVRALEDWEGVLARRTSIREAAQLRCGVAEVARQYRAVLAGAGVFEPGATD